MINPDIHITIYISEEVVRIACGTIAYAIAVYGIITLVKFLCKDKNDQENS